MNSIRAFRFTASLLTALVFAAVGLAQTATLTTPAAVYSAAGGSVTFNLTITYTGQTPTTLGANITLPTGWSFASATGTNVPGVVPDPGTTDAAEFAYTSFPANTATFSFVLNYTAGRTGNQTFPGVVQYKLLGGDGAFHNITLPNIVLAPALSALQAVPTKTLTAGTAAVSFTPVTGVNGAPAYTFAIAPALPSGLSLAPSSGAITGTPAAASGPTTFTVTITDTVSATANNTFSLTVNTALSSTLAVASKSLTINTAAAAFTPVTRTGGTSGFLFAVSPALPAGLALDPATGQITGTPTVTQASTPHTVTITDAVGAVTSKIFNLTVNAAPVATQAIASKTLTAGTAAVSFTPVMGSLGTPSLVYSVSPALPATLALNTSTGAITGTAASAASAATFTVTVTDANLATASNTFSLAINGSVVPTQAIATRILTAGTPAVAFTPVTAVGGTTPYTFTISPALPTGLSIDATNGSISGTAAAGATALARTVTITDSVGATATASFTLTVNTALNTTLAVATKALTINTAAVSFTPVTFTGGTTPFTYSVAPALPAGLTLGATGAITGTPTVTAVAANYDIMVADGVGAMSTKTLSLTVNSAVVATQALATRTLTAGSVASNFTPVTANGGTGALTYTVSPALQTGLSINATNGTISGTPTAALTATVFTVTATDTVGATGSATFTLDINGPIAANLDLATKAITAGTAASFKPVSGAGGTLPYVYTIAPALPSSLSIDSTTGFISGTAAAAATASNFTVTVKDATNATATRTFSLTVNAALTATQVIASKAITATTAVVSFTPVTGAAGTPPYSYTATLPANLSINPLTGAITGTATTPAVPTPITVNVSDSVGATTSNNFTLTVNFPLVAGGGTISSRTFTANALATTFTPLPLSAGTQGYTWSVAPALPAGLTLAPGTGAISGTPTTAQAATNYTVTGTDSVGATVTQPLSITINAALTTTQVIAARTLSAGGAASFTPVTAAGGTAPITLAVSPTLPAPLSFDPASGAITGTPAAAFTTATFTVTATDNVGATSSKTFSLTINGPLTATQAIASKSLTATTAAVAFTPVVAAGGTTPYAFTISPALPTGLTLNGGNGSISGTAAAQSGPTTFTVTVTDTALATQSNTFSLTVNPALTTTAAVPTKALSAGTVAVAFTPVTAANGTGAYAFTISPALPASLALNPTSGTISGTANAALAATTFTVTATDTVGATSNKTFSLTVNPAPATTLAVASKGLTINTAAVAFTPVTVTANTGTGPFGFAVSPALPAGLSMSAAGLVSGTPTVTAATANYTVTITDFVGAVTTRAFSLTVNGALSATQGIASKTLTTGIAAATFRPVFPAGGTAPYTFAVSPALPGALALNTSTGNISGTPAVVAGAATFTITITDDAGATATNTFSLTVNGPVTATQAVATKVLTAGTAAVAFTPVTASGGTPGYTFAVSPALPSNLSLNAGTGAISGTPAVASTAATYTITATDSAASTASATFSLTVNAAPTSTLAVATKALTINTLAVAFTPVTATGGTGALTFTVAPALPTGLTLNGSTGAITGTPTVASAATSYAITATDTLGATTSKTFSLTVNPAVVATQAIATRTLTAGAAATAFTPVTASGGTASYTYAVSPALPAALALNPTTGAITGTPGAALVATTFTVTVTDSVGATGTNTFSLTVNGAVTATQAVATKVLTAGTAAVAFTPVTAAAGTAPYSFSIAPALPSGLTLNPTNGAISGTAGAALTATTFTVTVTDASSATASRTFSLTVNGPVVATPTIASKTLTAGTAAVAFTPVTGSAGTPSYSFAVSPALPAPLALSPTTGAITGTPAAAAVGAVYTVTITDSLGSSANGTFSLTVNAALAANAGGVIASRTLTVGSAATPFTPLPLLAGTPAYTWSVAPALPAGLALSASTGAISGTPTVALVATNFTVTGTDSVGATVTQALSLTINGALTTTQAIATRTLSANAAATAFIPVTAAGGTTAYAFAITPALPAGLTFDTTTGSIAGTPTVALSATTFTVTVTDAANATSSKTFVLTVNGPLNATQVIASKSLTATTAAVAFAPVAGAGGTSPYTYAVSPALPTGLALSATTGNITGTTAVTQTATPYTVTVTDNATATATNTFSLTVNPTLTSTQAIGTKVLTNGAAAVAFAPVTPVDGTPSYTYAIAPALPAGLLLNPASGAISGTPGAALAATTFTVTITDSAGATTSKTFSLTVNGAPVAIAGQSILNKALTAGTAAIAFTPFPVTGGTAPYGYSISPALPAGLTLNPTSGSITGTALAATSSAVYAITVTDSVGAQATQTLTLVVNAAPVATPTVPNVTLLVNVAASPVTPVTATGGTPPYIYTINPALGAGLSISASTGAISGTPTVAADPVTHTVTATDAVGATASATFSLKINRAPAIITPPTVAASYLVGGTLTLNVVATGFPAPTYVWRKDGTPIGGNASATTASLSVPGLALTDAGNYDVIVTNEVTSVTSAAVLAKIYLLPAIQTPPADQTIAAGQNATFSVVVVPGNPVTPTYQWRRNGGNLSGATASTLTLTNVPLNGGGTIDVVVSNPGGSVTSTPAATLTVNPPAPVFAAGLPTTAVAVKDRAFVFPVSINNTTATFGATGLPGGLSINVDNGTISGTPTAVGPSTIVITATNSIGQSATFTLNLTVQAPPPVITSAASTSGRVGDATFSFQVAGSNTPTNYAATNLPPGLTINAGSGLISGTPSAAGSYTVGLTVSNASGSVSQPLVITIDPPLNAPVYSGNLTPSGTQGSAFTFTPAFGTVTAPYALTGTLPTGLTFTAATGVIAGTPTQTGTFTVTLTATNAGGSSAVQLTIVINAAPAAPVITSASTAPGRVGVAFTFNLTSSGTPAATSYNAVGLPAGLSLNAGNGAISGTPTAFGSFDVVVSATNTVGSGPTSILSISIAPSASAPVITSAPVANGQVGQAFTYQLTASNSPTSFQITSGALPPGLNLNAASGAVTGLPTAVGQTRVWFNATDSVGVGFGPITGLSLEVLFTIAPAAATPVVNSNGSAIAQVGQPFQYAITASGAPTGYGATGRPAWLALDAVTGILSGIPTEATTTPIAIALTATNGGGTGNPKTLSLTVQPAPATPVITSALSASGRVGTAFTYHISASESPTSYVAVGLPPGLSLDSSLGDITGTPTVSNSFDVVIRAANLGGLGAPATLTINIAPAAAAPAITSSASVAGQVGVAFSYQIVATNGPILSYALSGSGMLPIGLSLNTATGVISGKPADDPRTYIVELTATNAGGTSLPQPLSITLAPALGVPVLTTPLFATGQVGVSSGQGQDFPFTVTATNLTGSAPYSPPISLDAVNLPPGLAINPATGVIQGTPTTVGTTIATLVATNASGTGPSRNLQITIQPALAAPSVTPASAVGQVGVAFNHQIVATNSPTSYDVSGAPAWMTLTGTTGTITGVPTVPGNLTVQVTAANAAGSSAPAALTLTINAAAGTPVVTSSRTQGGTVGAAMTFTVLTSPAATTFVATGLPGGLSLNPATGEIAGTPNQSGAFPVTLTPSNGAGIGAPVIITITILPSVTFGP